MMNRIATDIIILILAFVAPWWLAMIAAVAALFYFVSFYEIIIIGVIIDSLYNTSVTSFRGIEFFATLTALALFVAVEVLKRRLRFYTVR